MKVLELRLADLSSFDVADMTAVARDYLGPDWLVLEISHDRDLHISLDLVSVGLGAVQCALAGIAIWIQARSDDSHNSKSLGQEVRKQAKASDTNAVEVAVILAALETTAPRIKIKLDGYRITVTRRGKNRYEIVGKRRKHHNN